MRINYRVRGDREYWARQWTDIPAEQTMSNRGAYRLAYVETSVTVKDGAILKAEYEDRHILQKRDCPGASCCADNVRPSLAALRADCFRIS